MTETVPSGTELRRDNHRPGDRLYVVERVLGSGGFGNVYLAVDPESNLQCAVKEYLVTGSSGHEQLKHEATVLSQLHHRNLPAFQDAFIRHERYYIVLSYIEGNDLTDLIREVRLRNKTIPIVQILSWLLAICDAVTFLHSQQPTIIHRDIKPDNIRITPQGTAILVDLGNAKAPANEGDRTLFFIRHQGTPGYAPPEQYPGGTGTNARSDVYALGATLFFALTAHEPPSVSVRNQSLQQGQPTLPSLQEQLQNNPSEESPDAIAARQFRLGVSKPSKPAPRHSRHIAQLGALPPKVLSDLNDVVQKAMALKPDERYKYVTEFADKLRQIVIALSPPTPPKRPVDPHSTQPNLDEIYEQIQIAKEEQASQRSDGSTEDAQPIAPPSGIVCPHCGKSLTPNPKAVFCPNCGKPLSDKTNRSQSNPQAQVQQAQVRDVAAEETQVIPPKAMQEAVAAYHAGKAQSNAASMPPLAQNPAHAQQLQLQQYRNPPSFSGVQSQAYMAPPQIAAQAMGSGTQHYTPIPQSSRQPGPYPVTNQRSSGNTIHLRPSYLIVGIIALVVIIVLVMLLALK